MTPAQLAIYADSFVVVREAAQEEKRQELYLSALLISGFVGDILSGRKRPSYEKVFQTKKKEMSDEEMYKQIVVLNAQLGGEVKKGDE